MQSYAPPRRKSSAGSFIAVVLILGFLFVCLLVAAGLGVVLFSRAEAQQAHAIAERERAIQQLERARAAELQARREAETAESFAQAHEAATGELSESAGYTRQRGREPIRVANREITLQLDAQGNIQMDGEPVDSQQLKTLLRDASKGRESALTVLIKADGNCLFEHVATVLDVCQELDVPNVRIAQRE